MKPDDLDNDGRDLAGPTLFVAVAVALVAFFWWFLFA